MYVPWKWRDTTEKLITSYIKMDEPILNRLKKISLYKMEGHNFSNGSYKQVEG